MILSVCMAIVALRVTLEKKTATGVQVVDLIRLHTALTQILSK